MKKRFGMKEYGRLPRGIRLEVDKWIEENDYGLPKGFRLREAPVGDFAGVTAVYIGDENVVHSLHVNRVAGVAKDPTGGMMRTVISHVERPERELTPFPQTVLSWLKEHPRQEQAMALSPQYNPPKLHQQAPNYNKG